MKQKTVETSILSNPLKCTTCGFDSNIYLQGRDSILSTSDYVTKGICNKMAVFMCILWL